MPIITATAAAALILIAVLLAAIASVLPGGDDDTTPVTSCGAPADIPPRYLALYQQAAAHYRIPWPILAAVGKTESDHGQSHNPGITSGTNHAGAAGPMQFMPQTWKNFGVDGNADGTKNIYDPADAIPAAANYLTHNGAPQHLRSALLRYNHDPAYVQKVQRLAHFYATAPATSTCTPPLPAGTGRAATAVAAATRWLGTPYSWGGGGLNGPTKGIAQGAGTIGFDCSGLTRYAWHQAGITLPRVADEQWRALPHIPPGQQTPGDLVFFQGADGNPSHPGHVGLVINTNRMIEVPHTGLRVRISPINTRHDLIGYARPGRR